MRWFTMIDAGLSSVFRRRELESIPGFKQSEFLRSLVRSCHLLLHVAELLAYHGRDLAAWLVDSLSSCRLESFPVVSILNIVAVVWVLPNVIRQASVQVLPRP